MSGVRTGKKSFFRSYSESSPGWQFNSRTPSRHDVDGGNTRKQTAKQDKEKDALIWWVCCAGSKVIRCKNSTRGTKKGEGKASRLQGSGGPKSASLKEKSLVLIFVLFYLLLLFPPATRKTLWETTMAAPAFDWLWRRAVRSGWKGFWKVLGINGSMPFKATEGTTSLPAKGYY